MNFLNFFLARLEEPSTYAGLGLIAHGALAVSVGDLTGIASIISGVGAVAVKEKGAK